MLEKPNKIRIGVLGCASIARRSVIPAILNLSDYFVLTDIASRTQEKADEFGKIFGINAIKGYEKLLNIKEIDAIYMPLPTGLHEEWVTKCLNAGKHVLVEKSLAVDFQSAIRLVDLAKSKKLLLMENFMFRYHRQHNETWNNLNNKQIGDIRLFRSQFGFPPLDRNNFRYDKSLGGGALLDAAAYVVRASQWFLGSVQEVLDATLYIDSEKDVDIYGNATLRNSQGIVSQLSFGFDNYYRCNYEFWGSSGMIYADKAFTPKPNESPNIFVECPNSQQKIAVSPDNHFENILKEFSNSIVNDNKNQHWQDILDQSKTLTEIKTKSTKIIL